MRMVAVSDIHERLDYLPVLRDVLAGADLVLLLGDLTRGGHARQARIVVEAFQEINPKVLALPGNMDHPDVIDYLQETGVNLHGLTRAEDGWGLAGLGGSNPTPFQTPFEMPETVIGEMLDRLLSDITTAPLRILAVHAPPRGTRVDQVRMNLHAGSAAVRQAIETHQPALVFCGHIHEAAGEDRLGESRIFNPGPFSRGGYILADWDGHTLQARLEYATA